MRPADRVVALAIALAAFGASAGAQTGDIRGVVRDTAGRPIRAADVRLLPDGPVASTDVRGRFQIRDVTIGDRRLIARRVGYLPQLHDVNLTKGARIDVTFDLEPVPVTLQPIVVRDLRVVPAEYRFTHRFDEFFLRRSSAVNGAFFDRQDIERAGGVVQALRTLPGTQAGEFLGNLRVTFSRCSATSQPAVIVNGISAGYGVLGTIPVTSIELIEVYRGVAEMPIEARGNACGAIVIYTK